MDPVPTGRDVVLDDFWGSDFDPTRQSNRIIFLAELGKMLNGRRPADARTLSNFEEWLHQSVSSGRDGPALYRQALAIAADSVRGEVPIAVFLARAKGELGYLSPRCTRSPGLAIPDYPYLRSAS